MDEHLAAFKVLLLFTPVSARQIPFFINLKDDPLAEPQSNPTKIRSDFDLGSPERRSLWPLLLPFAYLLHLGEEWWGGEGFPVWASRFIGRSLTDERFLLINGIAWPLMLLGSFLAVRFPSFLWLMVSFATVLLVNGVAHLLGSLASGSYSPGTITGVLIYVPLGVVTLRRGWGLLAGRIFWKGVALGVFLHAVVFAVAFRG
jgi:hypothetical protein